MPRRKTLLDLPPSYQEQAAKQLYGEKMRAVEKIMEAESAMQTAKKLRREASLRTPEQKKADLAHGLMLAGSGGEVFTLPYPPSVNTYWRSIIIRGQVRVLISKKGRDYKKAVAERLNFLVIPIYKGPLAINLKFYRPRRIGDLDNCLKATLDALKGILFVDDSQICEIHATREDDKENPRVEVSVRPMTQ